MTQAMLETHDSLEQNIAMLDSAEYSTSITVLKLLIYVNICFLLWTESKQNNVQCQPTPTRESAFFTISDEMHTLVLNTIKHYDDGIITVTR